MSEPAAKKQKQDTKFRKEYSKTWDFIKASPQKGKFFARCSLCVKDISIKHGGKNDISRHIASIEHSNRATGSDGSKKLSSMFTKLNSKTKTNDELQIKEELQETSEHNLDFNPLMLSMSTQQTPKKSVDINIKTENCSHECAGSSSTTCPVYEIRYYPIKPNHFKTATQLFQQNYELLVKHSKLFGFWRSEIGGDITQFVHIREYDSLSHRRQIRTAMREDEVWNREFVSLLTPCLSQMRNALMVPSPNSKINTDFSNDSSAVYLLDEVRGNNLKQLAEFEKNPGEILVGQFTGLLGTSNTEYRLWRYSDIDEATECSLKRAMDAPFEGSTMLLYPTNFSPLA